MRFDPVNSARAVCAAMLLAACGSDREPSDGAAGHAGPGGGAFSGQGGLGGILGQAGADTGGRGGGSSAGGSAGAGGAANSGGTMSGGRATGGLATGGVATGGRATGGSGTGGSGVTMRVDVDIYISNTCVVNIVPQTIDVPAGQTVTLTYYNRSSDYNADIWLSYGGGYLGLPTGDVWANVYEHCTGPDPYTAWADVSIEGGPISVCPSQRLTVNCL